jgi:Spy/CpxP family protein refolding chaperone
MESLTPAQRKKHEEDKKQRREVWERFREMVESLKS